MSEIQAPQAWAWMAASFCLLRSMFRRRCSSYSVRGSLAATPAASCMHLALQRHYPELGRRMMAVPKGRPRTYGQGAQAAQQLERAPPIALALHPACTLHGQSVPSNPLVSAGLCLT
jgi:hypothetical protein